METNLKEAKLFQCAELKPLFGEVAQNPGERLNASCCCLWGIVQKNNRTGRRVINYRLLDGFPGQFFHEILTGHVPHDAFPPMFHPLPVKRVHATKGWSKEWSTNRSHFLQDGTGPFDIGKVSRFRNEPTIEMGVCVIADGVAFGKNSMGQFSMGIDLRTDAEKSGLRLVLRENVQDVIGNTWCRTVIERQIERRCGSLNPKRGIGHRAAKPERDSLASVFPKTRHV